ncbi:MAG: HPr family phosphocarrier protein, partial [Clostridia bacterium]|nr:HPr family phosphocarrier protein [Clostridia bacterium]
KSLLGVLSLGIAKGMTITLTADGRGEEDALDGLEELINSGFSDI